MDPEQRSRFLQAIAAAGDSADMWQAGQDLGLERSDTESLATALMAEGLLEMVSLSGKVRLTPAGRQLLDTASPEEELDLAAWLQAVAAADGLGLPEPAARDLAADLATLEAQLQRSQPLTAVVNACLEAIADALAASDSPLAQELAHLGRRLRLP
jgi:hypothetical protein